MKAKWCICGGNLFDWSFKRFPVTLGEPSPDQSFLDYICTTLKPEPFTEMPFSAWDKIYQKWLRKS